MKKIILLLLIITATGCATPKYQKATLGNWAGHQGYHETKCSQNAYTLEYIWRGGYSMITSHKENLEKLKTFWHQRAKELCPMGYKGGPEIVFSYQSKIKEFYSPIRGFNEYPTIASGDITCLNL